MEVITIDSAAFLKLKEQLDRIESYIERTVELNKDIDDALEMSSKDVMEVLRISESTLYRWRKNGLVKYHYANSGDVILLQISFRRHKMLPSQGSSYA